MKEKGAVQVRRDMLPSLDSPIALIRWPNLKKWEDTTPQSGATAVNISLAHIPLVLTSLSHQQSRAPFSSSHLQPPVLYTYLYLIQPTLLSSATTYFSLRRHLDTFLSDS